MISCVTAIVERLSANVKRISFGDEDFIHCKISCILYYLYVLSRVFLEYDIDNKI